MASLTTSVRDILRASNCGELEKKYKKVDKKKKKKKKK
jgi:hypothetical protein